MAAPSNQLVTTEDVQAFWNANPCGHRSSRAARRRRYFAEVEHERYRHERHIRTIGAFHAFAGKDVLEIGCGMGTDGAQFALAGARYTGVDLTPASKALATENFRLRGLQGTFVTADASELPFLDGCFDHVYSFGVIHHAPDPARIVAEIRRVLRPGGTFCVMLYNKTSINYLVEICVLRRALRLLLVPRWSPRALAAVTGLSREKLERHRRILLGEGPMPRERWLSINTDGPDCPLSRVYGRHDVLRLFSGFDDVSTNVWFFDKRHWPGLGRLLSDRGADAIGRRYGWHRVIRGTRPT